jgi:hypothetical protein
MRDHLKILGWLYVASGIMVLLLGTLFGMVFGFAALASGEAGAGALVGGIGALVAMFMAALAVPSLLCGWGLLTSRPWSRMLGIVLSVLQLASFPVGTLLGVYGLWVLLNDDARRALEAGDPSRAALGA